MSDDRATATFAGTSDAGVEVVAALVVALGARSGLEVASIDELATAATVVLRGADHDLTVDVEASAGDLRVVIAGLSATAFATRVPFIEPLADSTAHADGHLILRARG